MWESICLTLMATAGNNIGKVLQKKGTVILPPLSFKLKVIRAYAFNKLWAFGFLMDIVGALLMLKALSLAPVSVIQPVSGSGLAILCVFSHFYLKEVMNAIDWVGIVLAGFGTIGVHPAQSRRREHELMESEVVEEIISGLESGILFGMASVISKMGFVLSEQGFSKIFVPICITISIGCSATGFFYQTQGLKHGRAIVVSTCAAVASIIAAVLAGMFALGEKLPSRPLARFSLLLGWLFIIVGVVLLVSSSFIIALLPIPLRRILRSSYKRNNQNPRRTTSMRSKDQNPSTVIHASTLHHLIASPVKEKP